MVTAAAVWLMTVGVLMAFRPRYCLHLFAKMSASLTAANWRVQLIEQGLRVLVGTAMIVRAPLSKLPVVLEVAGWLLVATSILIVVLPIRWHGKYGAFWVQRITPPAVRVLSPVPAVLGAGLTYLAI